MDEGFSHYPRWRIHALRYVNAMCPFCDYPNKIVVYPAPPPGIQRSIVCLACSSVLTLDWPPDPTLTHDKYNG